jgi:hypothetical protein
MRNKARTVQYYREGQLGETVGVEGRTKHERKAGSSETSRRTQMRKWPGRLLGNDDGHAWSGAVFAGPGILAHAGG